MLSFRRAILWILFSAISAFIFGVAFGYSHFSRFARPVMIQSAGLDRTNIITSVGDEAVDQVKGWKSYRNIAYGFELQYPENFELKEAPDDVGSIFYISNFTYDISRSSFRGLKNGNIVFRIVVEKNNTKTGYRYVKDGFESEVKNSTLSGIPALKSAFEEGDGGSGIGVKDALSILTYHQDKSYYLEIRPYNESSIQLFEEIIRTFKFIEI